MRQNNAVDLNEYDYEIRDYSYPTSKAYIYITVYSIILIIPLLITYSLLWRGQTGKGSFIEMLVNILVIFIFCISHELLHGLAAIVFCGASMKDIKFGVIWKALTPYAHCAVPMTPLQYTIMLFFPTVILGVIPYILSLLIHSGSLYFIGSVMLLGGLGDFFIFTNVVKLPKGVLIKDHPSLIGFIAYIKR